MWFGGTPGSSQGPNYVCQVAAPAGINVPCIRTPACYEYEACTKDHLKLVPEAAPGLLLAPTINPRRPTKLG